MSFKNFSQYQDAAAKDKVIGTETAPEAATGASAPPSEKPLAHQVKRTEATQHERGS